MTIKAITLDLDDTLWPMAPVLNAVARDIQTWLYAHYPEVAKAWSIAALRELRAQISAKRRDLSHDFSAQSRLTMQRAFAACGIHEAPLDALAEVYYDARNRVELYPDTLPVLRHLSAYLPLVSLTNGNADLQRIGLDEYFALQVCAYDIGCAKPDVRIFHAAATQLGIAPEEMLHVGDDPIMDVAGARNAGFQAAWLNRHGASWPSTHGSAPELDLGDLHALVDWLEARLTNAGTDCCI